MTASKVESGGRLLRVFGIVFGLAVIIGNTIGAGILAAPGEIAGRLPTPALFFGVWIAGGVYALLGALNLAELGAMLPRSGGQYVFARHAFGPYTGFVIGWSDWLSTCASTAAVSIVIGTSVGELVPAMAPFGKWVATATVVVFTAILWRGQRTSGTSQAVTSVLKGLALIALILACFLLRRSAPNVAAPAAVPVGGALFAAIVLSMQSIIYTYDGWNGVVYFSEEVHDPGRDIPRSMLGGVVSVIAVYVLLNLGFAYVLSLSGMANQSLVASSAARALFGPGGYTVVNCLTVLLLISSVNALLLMSSRVPVAMSQDGLFPAAASRVSRSGTPTVSLAASAAVSLGFIASGVFKTVTAIAAFYFVANYIVSFSAMFLLRRREPDRPRPYRAWGYPWTTGLALIGSAAFLIGAVVGDTTLSLYALALLAVSYPIYRVGLRMGAPIDEPSAGA
ncbi:MAG TPA: APC family permease [Gemmatimonadaceae bacterium]|nr:APC family permease [Gemmatimonadaceae bacterium]